MCVCVCFGVCVCAVDVCACLNLVFECVFVQLSFFICCSYFIIHAFYCFALDFDSFLTSSIYCWTCNSLHFSNSVHLQEPAAHVNFNWYSHFNYRITMEAEKKQPWNVRNCLTVTVRNSDRDRHRRFSMVWRFFFLPSASLPCWKWHQQCVSESSKNIPDSLFLVAKDWFLD